MRAIALFPALIALGVLTSPVSLAQQGFPLVGSWHGAWEFKHGDRKDLTVIMNWDGKQITGLVNPVTDHTPLLDARLNSSNWTVHFAVDLKKGSGGTMHCVADGKLQRLGSVTRTLAGQWVCGDRHGEFHLRRDRD